MQQACIPISTPAPASASVFLPDRDTGGVSITPDRVPQGGHLAVPVLHRFEGLPALARIAGSLQQQLIDTKAAEPARAEPCPRGRQTTSEKMIQFCQSGSLCTIPD